jgi:hypothetical protein
MLVLQGGGKDNEIPRPATLPQRHAGGGKGRGVGGKKSEGNQDTSLKPTMMGEPAAEIPGAVRRRTICGRGSGCGPGSCGENGQVDCMGGRA